MNIAGFELHADEWRGGAREPILLLHGLGGNAITWHGVAPRLAEAFGARVLAVDLPGFGASHPRGKRLGYSVLLQVVEELLRGERWHIAGNSLGGLLALNAAWAWPERVSGLTLAALALPLTWGRSTREVLAFGASAPAGLPWVGRHLVSRYVHATGLPGVVDDPVRNLFGDAARLDPKLRQRLIEVSEYRMTWVGEAARALERATLGLGVVLLWPNRAERWIREVRCPVQAIYGSADPVYPPESWRCLERLRPDWQHHCMLGIGHVPQLEAPSDFAELMIRASCRSHAASV